MLDGKGRKFAARRFPFLRHPRATCRSRQVGSCTCPAVCRPPRENGLPCPLWQAQTGTLSVLWDAFESAGRMSIVDLGAAASWKLKGQGNANAVFEYIGTDADKVRSGLSGIFQHSRSLGASCESLTILQAGQVLRVRKQKLLLDTHSDTPTELQLLEREIWGSLINDWSSGVLYTAHSFNVRAHHS